MVLRRSLMVVDESVMISNDSQAYRGRRKRFDLGEKFNNYYLTRREFEVLNFVIEGLSAKNIARQLNISSRTVEKNIDNIKSKLRCKKRSELVAICIKIGIISNIENFGRIMELQEA